MIRLLTVLICLILISPAAAKTVVQIDADQQYAFAGSYYSKGEYAKAVAEYERFVRFFPDDARIPKARFLTGMSYFKNGQFREAAVSFQETANVYPDSENGVQAVFMISESYLNLNEPGLAVLNLTNLQVSTDQPDIKDEAAYRIGWIYLETGAWEKAKANFGKIRAENRDKYQTEKLTAELDRANTLPRKNPTLAGILSVIPGAGFLYCERYQDALIAFLLNGGLIAAAFEAFDKEHYALGSVISFVELGFYAGNIYGSVSSAHKYNQSSALQFIEQLKHSTTIGLSPDPNGKGLALSFQCRF